MPHVDVHTGTARAMAAADVLFRLLPPELKARVPSVFRKDGELRAQHRKSAAKALEKALGKLLDFLENGPESKWWLDDAEPFLFELFTSDAYRAVVETNVELMGSSTKSVIGPGEVAQGLRVLQAAFAPTRSLRCTECRKIWNMVTDGYMVHDELWLSVAQAESVLHLRCLEKRLGRQLQPEDFTGAPVNNAVLFGFERGRWPTCPGPHACPMPPGALTDGSQCCADESGWTLRSDLAPFDVPLLVKDVNDQYGIMRRAPSRDGFPAWDTSTAPYLDMPMAWRRIPEGP